VYQVLLTRRYLTSKVMPLLASLAVVLCTAMVLIVWSVMGGFLVKLMNSGRVLVGDVAITWPNTGFAHYEDLVELLKKDPAVESATPMIETFGLLSLPSGKTEYVVVKGVEPAGYAAVTGYVDSLWWKPLDVPMPKDKNRDDERLDKSMHPIMERALANGKSLTRIDPVSGKPIDAIVMGIEIGDNYRAPSNVYFPLRTRRVRSDGTVELLNIRPITQGVVKLSVLPMDSQGQVLDMASTSLPIANEFKTGMYEVDNRTVLVPLHTLQKMLRMDEAVKVDQDSISVGTSIDENGNEVFVKPSAFGTDPARVTNVIVKAKGIDSEELKIRCAEIYEQFANKHLGSVPAAPSILTQDDGHREVVPDSGTVQIRTWEDLNATFIGAVKKETGLVLFIFSFVSLTAVFLVLAIFWSMVSEKTKDVGVLRSMGASRTGVAAVWLSYGLAIGLVGSLLGGGLAYTIVTNINPIHDWMGEALGLQIWNPRIYYFTEIPSKVDPQKAMIVMIAGALSSVVGALIPALRAAFLHPVKALRFE
jgi:lipoprotein-releasing system permease protein